MKMSEELIKKAREAAKEQKEGIKRPPKMISVIRDTKTNQLFIETSGKPFPDNIHPEIIR
ncbi:hypothetical protein QUF80_02170 [Desulfococcaceae bacterium HSG8]|nr:hypothetical protein [Desulfococcaceae bacterium HSG8]